MPELVPPDRGIRGTSPDETGSGVLLVVPGTPAVTQEVTMDQSTAALGRRLVTVEVADCPICLSAGSVRRGVCDICGARSAKTKVDSLDAVGSRDAE
jgi:hypothetical protein